MSDTTLNGYGIPVDPDLALEWVKSGKIVPTENPNEVTGGQIIELMEINVPHPDKELDANGKPVMCFSSGGANFPFGHTRYDNFGAILENEGGELDDSQVELLQALIASSNKNTKAFKSITDTVNSVNRQNAKQAETARVRTLKLPMSEETKQKGIERTVSFIANSQGISLEMARKVYEMAIASAKA